MDSLLALIIGSLTASIVYLGIGLQKKGIKHYIYLQQGLRSWLKAQESWEWAIGCLSSAGGNLVFFWLMAISSITLIMPLNGVGLIVLTFFAVIVLHEAIGVREYVSIGSICIGIILTTIIAQVPSNTQDVTMLLIMSGISIIICLFLGILRLIKRNMLPGVPESLLAGVLAGHSSFMMKSAALTPDESIRLLFILLFFVLQFVSWFFNQLAYSSGKATIAVPIFTAVLIAYPIIGGLLIYSEIVDIIQIIGILLVTLGGMVLARYAAIPN